MSDAVPPPVPHGAEAPPPATVGGHRIGRLLGSGASGRVYEAVDARGRRVALKLIRAERAADPGFRTRFRREVETARRMPARFTAQVVDAEPDGDPPWVATALLSGPTLERRVRDGGPLRGRELTRLATGLLRALTAMHAAGLAHRDLKPANVVLTPRGPMVVDFGIAHTSGDTRMTRTGSTLGTPAYMAPEQAEGSAEPGPAADVHAFGAVLVFAATGAPPYPGDSVAAVLYRLLHEAPELGGTPEPWRGIAAECLRRDPGHRPTAADLSGRTRRTGGRRAVRVGILAALVLGTAAVLLGPWLAEQLAPGPGTGVGSGSGQPGGGADPGPGPDADPGPGPGLDPTVPGNGPAATVPGAPPSAPGPVVALPHTAGRVVAGVGRIYVADPEGGAVTVLDTGGRTVGRVEVGRFPAALALSADGSRLVAALGGTPVRVVAVDTRTLAVTGGADVAEGSAGADIVRPPDVAILRDPATARDTIVVSDPRTSRVVALDAATLRPLGAADPAERPLAVAAADGGVLVAGSSPGGGRIETLGPPWTATGPGVAGPQDVVDLLAGPDGAALVARAGNVDGVGGLRLIGSDGTVRAERPDLEAARLGAGPVAGGLVYVLDATTGTVTAVDAATLATVARIDPGAGGAAADVAVSPDGRALYVAADRSLRIVR